MLLYSTGEKEQQIINFYRTIGTKITSTFLINENKLWSQDSSYYVCYELENPVSYKFGPKSFRAFKVEL